MDEPNAKKTKYISSLHESLDTMREKQLLCDFTIKVGDKSFPVHRMILASCSEYFRLMLSQDMKEAREGVVEFQDMTEEAVKQCIDYVYTGEAEVTLETASDILHSASIMQLKELREKCFSFLGNHLSLENYFDFRRIALVYGAKSLLDSIKEFISQNFDVVIDTTCFGEFEQEDLEELLTQYEGKPEIAWKAIMTWITEKDVEERAQLLESLFDLLDYEASPFKYLVKNYQTYSSVHQSQVLKDALFNFLFSDLNKVRKGVGAKNCLSIKEMVKNFYGEDVRKVKILVFVFLKNNLEVMANNTRLYNCAAEEMREFLEIPFKQYSSEKLKWELIINWINRDRSRIKMLPDLMKKIKLEWLPKEFINETILTNSYVAESKECKELVTKNLITKDHRPIPYLTVLHNSNLYGLNLVNNEWGLLLEDVPGSKIVSVGGELYLQNQKKVFTYSSYTGWVKKTQNSSLRSYSKLVDFRGCLYVVNENNMSYYDPVQNVWILNVPGPACGMKHLFSSQHYIYCMQYPHNLRVKKYKVIQNEWSDVEFADAGSTGVELHGNIYIMGGGLGSRMIKKDWQTGLWGNVSGLPTSENVQACAAYGKVYVFMSEYCDEEDGWEISIHVYDPITDKSKILVKNSIIRSSYHDNVFSICASYR